MESDKRQKLLEEMRKRMGEKVNKYQKDPLEFRPPVMEQGKSRDYYFHVLPLVEDEVEFFYKNGAHFINNRYIQCPRAHDTVDADGRSVECPCCQLGFDLMEGQDDKTVRSKIAKKFLPQQKYAMNILFTDDEVNGDLRGKVMWYNAPSSVWTKMKDALLRNDPGSNKHKPLAFGIFTDVNNSYIFNLNVCEKGEYNNYDKSEFLGDKTWEIANAEQVLAARPSIKDKFPKPDITALADYATKQLSDSGDVTTADTKSDTKSDAKTESKAKTETVKTEAKKPDVKTEVKKPEQKVEEVKVEVKKSTSTAKEVKVEAKKPDTKQLDDDAELESLLKDLNSES